MNEKLGLEGLEPAGCYHSAWVFLLPPAIRELVYRLRQTTLLPGHPCRGLLPHLTVLYLGLLRGDRLIDIAQRLAFISFLPIETNICGLGTFGTEARINEIHLSVGLTPNMLDLHLRTLELCESIGHPAQTPFVRDQYVPHICIVDGLNLDQSTADQFLNRHRPTTDITLESLQCLAVLSRYEQKRE